MCTDWHAPQEEKQMHECTEQLQPHGQRSQHSVTTVVLMLVVGVHGEGENKLFDTPWQMRASESTHASLKKIAAACKQACACACKATELRDAAGDSARRTTVSAVPSGPCIRIAPKKARAFVDAALLPLPLLARRPPLPHETGDGGDVPSATAASCASLAWWCTRSRGSCARCGVTSMPTLRLASQCGWSAAA